MLIDDLKPGDLVALRRARNYVVYHENGSGRERAYQTLYSGSLFMVLGVRLPISQLQATSSVPWGIKLWSSSLQMALYDPPDYFDANYELVCQL